MRTLEKHATQVLKEWLLSDAHFNHPYPTNEERDQLAIKANITPKQVRNWFVNARKRIWRPMKREMEQRAMTTNADIEDQKKNMNRNNNISIEKERLTLQHSTSSVTRQTYVQPETMVHSSLQKPTTSYVPYESNYQQDPCLYENSVAQNFNNAYHPDAYITSQMETQSEYPMPIYGMYGSGTLPHDKQQHNNNKYNMRDAVQHIYENEDYENTDDIQHLNDEPKKMYNSTTMMSLDNNTQRYQEPHVTYMLSQQNDYINPATTTTTPVEMYTDSSRYSYERQQYEQPHVVEYKEYLGSAVTQENPITTEHPYYDSRSGDFRRAAIETAPYTYEYNASMLLPPILQPGAKVSMPSTGHPQIRQPTLSSYFNQPYEHCLPSQDQVHQTNLETTGGFIPWTYANDNAENLYHHVGYTHPSISGINDATAPPVTFLNQMIQEIDDEGVVINNGVGNMLGKERFLQHS